METTKGEVCPKLNLSISMREGVIRIGKGVIDVLGVPQYVCIYISKSDDALMVRECEKKEYLSLKVTRNDNVTPKKNLRLYSLEFTTDIFLMNNWNPESTYQMKGTFEETRNAVIFRYERATAKTDKDEMW